MTPGTCPTCRYSDTAVADDGEELLLHCKRYPPQIFDPADGVVSQTWPTMHEQDRCGEWGYRTTIDPMTRSACGDIGIDKRTAEHALDEVRRQPTVSGRTTAAAIGLTTRAVMNGIADGTVPATRIAGTYRVPSRWILAVVGESRAS